MSQPPKRIEIEEDTPNVINCGQCHSLMFATAPQCEHCGWANPNRAAPPPARPRRRAAAVPARFGALRLMGGLFLLVGLSPWACVVAVLVLGNRAIWDATYTPAIAIALGAAACVTTLGAVAIGELFNLLVSVEHQLRTIAARLDRQEP